MTKEECLQRVNEYCSERSYDGETLTDEFKDKFADFFVKRHGEDGIDDDGIMDELKFNLDTAKSAATRGIMLKQRSFESKERDYTKQIQELNTRLGEGRGGKAELPDDVKQQIQEFANFKKEQQKQEKFKEVLAEAKKNVRTDLHSSLVEYASDFAIDVDGDVKEQARRLTEKFQRIFKESIGDIKPLTPKIIRKTEEDLINAIPKVKL